MILDGIEKGRKDLVRMRNEYNAKVGIKLVYRKEIEDSARSDQIIIKNISPQHITPDAPLSIVYIERGVLAVASEPY